MHWFGVFFSGAILFISSLFGGIAGPPHLSDASTTTESAQDVSTKMVATSLYKDKSAVDENFRIGTDGIVYVWGTPIQGADTSTFVPLPYSCDSSIDTASSTYLYSKDKNHVYFSSGDSPKSESPTWIISGADPVTFQVLGGPFGDCPYAKDKNHVYQSATVMEAADSQSFQVLSTVEAQEVGWMYTSQDKNYRYKYGKTVQ